MVNSGRFRLGVVAVAALLAACPGPSAARRADELMRAGLDALYERHDPESAAAAFRKVLAIDADHYGANFQLAWALEQAGRKGEARPVWEKVARMADAHRDGTTAATARRFVAAGVPDNPEELMKAGLQALYASHEPAVAAELFRRILAANPNHYGANFQLAAALDLSGNRAEALRFWQKTLDLARAYKDQATIDVAQRRLAR